MPMLKPQERFISIKMMNVLVHLNVNVVVKVAVITRLPIMLK